VAGRGQGLRCWRDGEGEVHLPVVTPKAEAQPRC
jgi:hypothetical protein